MDFNKKIHNIYEESLGKKTKKIGLNIIRTNSHKKINFAKSVLEEKKNKDKNELYEEKGLFRFQYYNNSESKYINIFGEKFVENNKKKFKLIFDHKETELINIIFTNTNHFRNKKIIKIFLRINYFINSNSTNNHKKRYIPYV